MPLNMPTNRQYLIDSLMNPDFVDDGGADYEALIYYHINCPYFGGDSRCLCNDLELESVPRKMCFECKENWLDQEVDI